ncbi:MAG: hypothetical protein ACR2M3_05940 [Thermomicrobiales bacterium]
MKLGASYFQLPFAFATRSAAVTGLPFEDALLRYTPYYNELQQPERDFDVARPHEWDFDPAHPRWQAFLAAIQGGADPAEYVYLRTLPPPLPPSMDDCSCFNFEYEVETRAIRMHFANNAPNGAALRREQIPSRRRDLHDLFTEIAQRYPEAERVRGASWLYNLPAYRRLFPPEYVANIHPLGSMWQFVALWGQFLNHCGEVKADMAQTFLSCLATKTTLDGLASCFPYQVLTTTCGIDFFYRLYGVRISPSPLLTSKGEGVGG